MDFSTLKGRLETATMSFKNLELQLADPDVSLDPKQLENISRERARLEPLVLDYESLKCVEDDLVETKNLLRNSKEDKDMESLAEEELQRLDALKVQLLEGVTHTWVLEPAFPCVGCVCVY